LKLPKKNEYGQITVLFVAMVLVLLASIPLSGALAELLIAQQRLSALADSTALAGAQELEFNNASACKAAKSFASFSNGVEITCISSATEIQVTLVSLAPKSMFTPLILKLSAKARAGIADTNAGMP